LACWLDPQKTHHLTATQPAHWSAHRCLSKSYNIRPIFASAYCGVFIELSMEFADEGWISDFGIATDMIRQLNHINVQIQGKDQLLGNPP
jgi:hypothetical protein